MADYILMLKMILTPTETRYYVSLNNMPLIEKAFVKMQKMQTAQMTFSYVIHILICEGFSCNARWNHLVNFSVMYHQGFSHHTNWPQ